MKKNLTEFIGTFFLLMGATQGGAVGASLILMIMVYAGGHISGAHYNPAVSLAVWIRGKMTPAEMISYWISQAAGAIAAALVVAKVFGVEGTGACTIPADGLFKGILAEVMGTFVLAYVVLNVATSKSTEGNSYYGIAIGGTVLAIANSIGKIAGSTINPALAIGFCIQKSICWEQLLFHLVGCFAGAALAGFVYNYLKSE